MQEALKDKEGTIETLERQLVQAGIKGKVMQAEVEISKKKEEVKSGMTKELTETEAKQKTLQNAMSNHAEKVKAREELEMQKKINNLENQNNVS